MEFQTLKKSHKKEIIIGVSLLIILGVVLIVRFTFAKYELVKSIKIAEGTINYKVPDFKMIAMYKNDGNGDIEIETMPESGYAINEIKSYCTLDNINKDAKANLYTDENGQHIISGLSKFSKCYLYFDKARDIRPEIIAQAKSTTPDFSKTAQKTCSGISDPCEETNGVYKAKDNDGDSYYFRGAVENNYVRFAGLWWRIIRINGDGTIRLIYDGTSAHQNGEETTDSIAVASQTFNASYNNNAYVGFKYTLGEVYGLGTSSNALEQLETWYTNNLVSYAAKIDNNAGFCGDREPSSTIGSSNGAGGTDTTTTYYGGYIRLYTNKTPILTCANTSDLYTVGTSTKGNKSLTYPIGLITADEVAMVGGVYGTANSNYYLYNGQDYWTLSPSGYPNANVFLVNSGGRLTYTSVYRTLGLCPVINLKADIKLTGKGTTSDPYVVS